MVKKRKNKKKQEISDYGAQQLIRIDKKIIRLVDKAEFRLAFSKANGGRRIEKVNNSVLENYYHRNLLDIKSPNPSVETFLHAFLPFKFVDHTHSDAIMNITNRPNGLNFCKKIFGKKVLVKL